jgi:hypothetical protein
MRRMLAYKFVMADSPKSIREVNFQVGGLEARVELTVKLIIAVVALLATLLAAGGALYIQLSDIKSDMKVEVARFTQRLDAIDRSLAEARTNDGRSLAALSRIEAKLGSDNSAPAIVAARPPTVAAMTAASSSAPLTTGSMPATAAGSSPEPPTPALAAPAATPIPGLILDQREINIVRRAVGKRTPTSARFRVGEEVPLSLLTRLPEGAYQAVPKIRNFTYTFDAVGSIVLVSPNSGQVATVIPPN